MCALYDYLCKTLWNRERIKPTTKKKEEENSNWKKRRTKNGKKREKRCILMAIASNIGGVQEQYSVYKMSDIENATH